MGLNSKALKLLMNDKEKEVASMMIRLETLEKKRAKATKLKKAIYKEQKDKEQEKLNEKRKQRIESMKYKKHSHK